MCRHVQDIAELHGLPTSRVTLQYVYHGMRSVVIELPDCTVKIAPPDVIEAECSAHAALDHHDNIRKSSGRCAVFPESLGLGGILLEGPGLPVSREDVKQDFSRLFAAALAALTYVHSTGHLHRDVKLSNMVCVCGVLKLNDFETVCRDPWARPVLGTPLYHSGVHPSDFETLTICSRWLCRLPSRTLWISPAWTLISVAVLWYLLPKTLYASVRLLNVFPL